eukprot:g8932.t1
MDVLLEDERGAALLCDALHAHGAREVQSDTGMANAGAAFEVKYFVRTFEPFASKNDVQKALALWVLEEAACLWVDATGLTDAVAAQYDALHLEKKNIEEKYGPLRIWDLALLSDLNWLVPLCCAVAADEGLGARCPDLHLLPRDQLSSLGEYFSADISGWDVSGATDLHFMFHNCTNFNSDISAWDVSKVESFAYMFMNCQNFDQDLGSWNVGNGVDFSGMFSLCKTFDQNLAAWNVGNGRDFSVMFSGTHLFNRPLDPWDVAKAETMPRMFSGCAKFNQPLASWQVGKARDFHLMFEGCAKFNQPLNSWDVSSATDFLGMFQQCAEFAQDLGSWKVSEEARVDDMFAGCARFGPALSPWSISDPKNQRARVLGPVTFDCTGPAADWI